MTTRQFRNLKLPALVKRMHQANADRECGDIFVINYSNLVELVYESEEHIRTCQGHNFRNLKLIEENYRPREVMLELEEVL